MIIRASTKQPGMFYLIWKDSGVEGGKRFTKIETADGKRSQDVTLMNGLETAEILYIDASRVDFFFDMAAEVGVTVQPEHKHTETEMRKFSGRVTTTPRIGMKVQIKRCCVEGIGTPSVSFLPVLVGLLMVILEASRIQYVYIHRALLT